MENGESHDCTLREMQLWNWQTDFCGEQFCRRPGFRNIHQESDQWTSPKISPHSQANELPTWILVGLAFVCNFFFFLAINMTCPKSSTYSLVACSRLCFLNCNSQINSISGNLSLFQFTSWFRLTDSIAVNVPRVRPCSHKSAHLQPRSTQLTVCQQLALAPATMCVSTQATATT